MTAVPRPPGTETCGCCGGTPHGTPRAIGNRPGLPEIAYRSGTWGDFRAAMIAGLSRAARPALAGLSTRDDDDPTMALLDAWAVACDVLTFYAERLANEAFLRTASDRVSLQELGKLVAFRLGHGVAAETVLAFSLERPPRTAPLDPPDPGVVPPAVPRGLVLPERLRVQSVPGPGGLPQTFETVEAVEARPEWNVLPVARTAPHPPAEGRVDAWLAGTGLNLAPGDVMLFVAGTLADDRWAMAPLTHVEVDLAGGRTHVTWANGLGDLVPAGGPVPPAAYVLRRRLSVFGHNAPVWKAMIDEFRTGYRKQFDPPPPDGAEWPFYKATVASGSFTVVDVEGAHPDVVEGSWVVLAEDASAKRGLFRVKSRAELSLSAFAVSGRATRLTLEGDALALDTPRGVSVLAVPQPLTVVEAPDAAPVDAATIVVDGDATAMAPGRSLLLTGMAPGGTPQVEMVTVASVAAAPGGRTAIELEAAPTVALDRATALVLGNVAPATHGETVTEVLGSGDARVPFQAFGLRQGPLTFVPADNPRGAASTLEVQVDGVRWAELATSFGAGPRDRVHVTRDEPDGTVTVVFGDGVRGARPPSGSNNLRATYRKGIGAAGNVGADTLTQALDRPLGLKGVTNPAAATGGVDPEPEAHARASIPLPVRTLGRAVSLLDYADFALAFTGIGKAVATVLPMRAGRTILVTVADGDGLPPPSRTVERLAGELRKEGDPNVRVSVLPCRAASFRLALAVTVDPGREAAAVLAAVETALRATYGRTARSIGEPVHRSAVVAVAAAVPGVLAVDLDRLYRGTPDLAERLLADGAQAVDGTPVAAELLAISDLPFDWLLELP
jgi:predicted phage baseplate assembly protein